jgi:predicted nuclease with TOPRIM domain
MNTETETPETVNPLHAEMRRRLAELEPLEKKLWDECSAIDERMKPLKEESAQANNRWSEVFNEIRWIKNTLKADKS